MLRSSSMQLDFSNSLSQVGHEVTYQNQLSQLVCGLRSCDP